MAFSSLNPFNYEKPAAWGPTAHKHLKNIAQAQQNEANNGVAGTNRYSSNENELQQHGDDLSKTATRHDLKKWLDTPAGERGALHL